MTTSTVRLRRFGVPAGVFDRWSTADAERLLLRVGFVVANPCGPVYLVPARSAPGTLTELWLLHRTSLQRPLSVAEAMWWRDLMAREDLKTTPWGAAESIEAATSRTDRRVGLCALGAINRGRGVEIVTYA